MVRRPHLLIALGVALSACMESRGPVLSELWPDAGGPDAACEGCAVPSFEVQGELVTESVGGTNGTEYRDVCPAGRVLTGYRGELRDISATERALLAVSGLSAMCGAPSVDGTSDVQIVEGEALATRGEPSVPVVATWSQTCPPGQVIVGVDGRAGLAVDQLAFVCASLRAPSSSVPVEAAQENVLPAAGGPGGDAFSLRCPEGQVARGHSVRAGRWLDAYALVCGTPEWVDAAP